MAAPLPSARAEFDEVLASLTQTDRLKSRQEVLAKEADIARRKADVAARVREVYQKQGVEVSDELITQGVDRYFEGRLRFVKPSWGLALLPAMAWLYRWLILGFSTLFVGLLILANVLVYYTVTLPKREALAAETAEVHRSFAQLGRQLKEQDTRVRAALQALGAKIEASAALELPALNDAAALAKTQLEALEQKWPRLEGSIKGTDANDAVPEDLQSAKARVAQLQADLNSDLEVLKALQKLETRFDSLIAADRHLETTWKQIEGLKLPQSLLARSMTERDKALEEIGHLGEPAVVLKSVNQLNLILSEARVLAGQPDLLRDTAKTARLLSQESTVNRSIDQLEQQGLNAVERGDPSAARVQLERLQGLVRQLDLSYSLRIVNRSGEYSRIWYNNASRTGKLYYVIVEAVDRKGQTIPMQITSEQDGSTRTVSCWAESVDAATYEAVGADKKDDGIIQHDQFGTKERGYLTPRYLMGSKVNGGDPERGRLNRWPKK